MLLKQINIDSCNKPIKFKVMDSDQQIHKRLEA